MRQQQARRGRRRRFRPACVVASSAGFLRRDQQPRRDRKRATAIAQPRACLARAGQVRVIRCRYRCHAASFDAFAVVAILPVRAASAIASVTRGFMSPSRTPTSGGASPRISAQMCSTCRTSGSDQDARGLRHRVAPHSGGRVRDRRRDERGPPVGREHETRDLAAHRAGEKAAEGAGRRVDGEQLVIAEHRELVFVETAGRNVGHHPQAAFGIEADAIGVGELVDVLERLVVAGVDRETAVRRERGVALS